MVGTTNKSMAAMSGAWLRRNVRHPWLGGPRRLTMYLATLDCAISNPSFSSSPWMRGAPQSGFSMLIRRINPRRSVSICGRPPRTSWGHSPNTAPALSSIGRATQGLRGKLTESGSTPFISYCAGLSCMGG